MAGSTAYIRWDARQRRRSDAPIPEVFERFVKNPITLIHLGSKEFSSRSLV